MDKISTIGILITLIVLGTMLYFAETDPCRLPASYLSANSLRECMNQEK
jgi:hypothetical protein